MRAEQKLAEAAAAMAKAPDVERSIFGKNAVEVADTLALLGRLHRQRDDWAAASKVQQDVLAIRTSRGGAKHWQTTDARLAVDYTELLRAMPAAKLAAVRRADERYELAGALRRQGKYRESLKPAEEAVALRRELLGEEHAETAHALHRLGRLHLALKNGTGARSANERALQIRRKVLGELHPDTGRSHHNLGSALHFLGEKQRAIEEYERAIAIWRHTLGETDELVALGLNSLGDVLYYDLRQLAAARKHYEDALAIRRSKLAKDDPGLRSPLRNLMFLESRDGNDTKSLAYLQELTYLTLARQERDGLARSEREQLASAANARADVDRLLQVLLKANRFEDGYDLAAAAKGAVTARQRWLRLQRDLTDPRTAEMLAELRAVDGQLLHFGLERSEAGKQPALDLGERLARLTRRREELERQLIAGSPAFRAEKQRVRRGLKEIAVALPTGAVLLDFVEYVPATMDRKSGKETLQPAQLGAFVVRPGPKVHWTDLGRSDEMAALVERWRRSYGAAGKLAQTGNAAAELRKQLWDRLAPHVAGAKLVLVAPEGPLNGLPFGALPGSKAGGYLLEEYAFANVPVPQLLPDLLARTEPHFDRPISMLLVGDVDFGAGEDFPRLAGTGVEINDIRVKFQDTFTDGKLAVLRKDKATKPAFAAAVRAPRYVHLATHGTFADPSVKSVLALENRERALRSALAFDRQVVGAHPGLLSGIVFAGANHKDKKAEAILTALEVSEMELRGVDLVVLSACDTGLGRVAGGEGVLGLQRAFQVAGARTTITSLWKVDDTATQRLMSRFYENLWDKKMTKVEALRQAQLWMMREGGTRGLDLPADTKTLPPQYWAAFVLSGDWR